MGEVVFSANDCKEVADRGGQPLLVRSETSPEDVGGMSAAVGLLTQRGGMTSHAAVVARGWGKPCIVGCEAIEADEDAGYFSLGGAEVRAGEILSIDGATGKIYLGELPVEPPSIYGNLATVMEWIEEVRQLGVLANADSPADAKRARENGAEGIGLTRSEHMFFESPERIRAMRNMIASPTLEGRRVALEEIEAFQEQDYEGIFEVMTGLPVTIRLLDPPLHEFLPHGNNEGEIAKRLSDEVGCQFNEAVNNVRSLQENNPMLGFRGCRLSIAKPEVGEVQVRAIARAARTAKQRGYDPCPEIMVPLLALPRELEGEREKIERVWQEEAPEIGLKVGTMLETPRAALVGFEMAKHADFFSFGSNDLTQMTFGLSRDDAGSVLPMYKNKGILSVDPFQVLDQEGVGQLIRAATTSGKEANPGLKTGLCGEHGALSIIPCSSYSNRLNSACL